MFYTTQNNFPNIQMPRISDYSASSASSVSSSSNLSIASNLTNNNPVTQQQQHQHQHQQHLLQVFQRQFSYQQTVGTQQATHSTGTNRRATRNKSKRVRTIFTPEQLKRLEQEFANQMYLVGNDRGYLANSLNLTEAQVKVWFQNRRIKFRKLQPSQESPQSSNQSHLLLNKI